MSGMSAPKNSIKSAKSVMNNARKCRKSATENMLRSVPSKKNVGSIRKTNSASGREHSLRSWIETLIRARLTRVKN